MYIPTNFKITDSKLLSRLIADNPLGILISHGHDGIETTPLPFLLREKNGKKTLVAHGAKANPHFKALQKNADCVVIFSGHNNYITPSWYPSKQTTHQVVPTWNYEIVEIRGQATIHEDINWLLAQVNEITNMMEKGREKPWKVSDAPSSYIDSHIKGTIGIEINITQMNGKWKMSQNKPSEVSGIIEGLSDPNDPHCNVEVAAIISKLN